jgi:hypothetical protein
MSGPLAPEDFLPHLRREFRVGDWPLRLTLDRVDVLPLTAQQARLVPRQPFTLIFSGPPGNVLAEGLHQLATEDGAAFEIYLMPVHTPSRERQDYQAVFN